MAELTKLKWEKIFSEHSNYLNRAAVFGGWLVMSTDDVIEYQGDQSHKTGQEGYQWRTSICFIPDPSHSWDLTKDYGNT